MLLWRPSERNKYIFLLELILISTLAHGILGILLFVVYKGGISSFHVELGRPHSPTLFVPLKRPSMFKHGAGPTQGRVGLQRTAGSGRASKSIELTDTDSQKTIKPKRQLGSYTTMGLESGHSDKKRKKSFGTKQVQHKKVEKKNRAKPAGKAKKFVEPKTEPVEQRQDEKIQPKIEQAPIEQKPAAALVGPVAQQAEPIVPQAVPGAPQQIAGSQELPIIDGSHEQELGANIAMDEIIIGAEGYVGEYVTAEQARMHECIEQEIVSRWKPPRGLPKELACQIKCCIGGNGTVVSCTLEKPSGVLIYDMAARSAARAMTLPRWAWGKEFTIVFKQ